MPMKDRGFDSEKFVNTAQIGGIERYTIDEGPGRGVRVLCVNTGAGLRYRVLADRGLDIDQACFHQHGLAFLPHHGVTAPSRAMDHGVDFLKNIPLGLLTTCGPTNIGPPCEDAGETLGLHGPHSNSVATIESVIQPDPRRGRMEMSVTGVIHYGALFGLNLELRRTIRSVLGTNRIDFVDEFFNAHNIPAPHAWLLHINFGYPLLDAGAEFCVDTDKVEPRQDSISLARFKDRDGYKRVPPPLKAHRGKTEVFGYLFPRPIDRQGRAMVGIVNRKLGIGVAIHYSTREFGRCGSWQHFGPGEYVAALEPMNGTVEKRNYDRERGLLDHIPPRGTKTYRYSIEVLSSQAQLAAMQKLNR